MGKVKLWRELILVVGLIASQTPLAASSYLLDSNKSSLYFVSTKQTHVVESHSFSALSGSISDDGAASLTINLSSVETGVGVRNQRARDLLFEVGKFSDAIATVPVDLDGLAAQAVGGAQIMAVSATLNLHGVSSEINTKLIVTKLSDSTIMVQNASPILISAGDYKLAGGVDALRNVAKLDVISYAVPVNFTLFFNKP